jgi:hypothetical protein
MPVRESPLQRGIRVTLLGAAPASLLFVAALMFAPGAKSLVLGIWLVAAMVGTVGLWLAVVLDPRVVTTRSSLVAALLVCGIVASWPIYIVLAKMVAETVVPSLKTLGSGKFWFALWLFLGPVVCALIYLVHHALAVVQGRGRAGQLNR